MNILSFAVIAVIVFISIHKFQGIVTFIQGWSTEPEEEPREVKTFVASILLLIMVGACAGFYDAGVSVPLEGAAVAVALLGAGIRAIYKLSVSATPPYGNH